MASTHTVGVALVHWNSGTLTGDCIQSLLEGDARPQQIVVYDNGSTDGFAGEIARQYPEVTLIRGERNIGFTGANNAAISLLMDRQVDYVWILNNDTVVDKHCLSRLIHEMEADSTIAASSAKILSDNEVATLWYAGAHLLPLTLEMPRRGEGVVDSGQYDLAEDVSFLTGCCMFVRRSAIEAIGPFDDSFFAYCEDEDWCLRALKAGLRLRYVPEAVIRHRISASIGRNAPASGGTSSPFARYLTSRNRLKLIKKNASNPVVLFCALAAQLANSLAIIAGTVALGRWMKAKAVALGIFDGLLCSPSEIPRPAEAFHPRAK